MKDHLWALRSAKRDQNNSRGGFKGREVKPTGRDPVNGAPDKTTGLGQIARAADNPHLVELGYEGLGLAEFKNNDVSAIRDALLTQNDAGSALDRAALCDHLENCGKMRAADLLKTYPDIPEIAPGGPEEREWLIALEQYARTDGTDPSAAFGGDAFASPEDARMRHRLVSERKARIARLNEAAEQADQD
jgi:DNA primase